MYSSNEGALVPVERRRERSSQGWRAALRGSLERTLLLLACTLALFTASRLASAAANVSLVIESPPGPVLPGQTVLFQLRVANESKDAPSGALVLEANIPQFVGIKGEPWGKCSPSDCYYNGHVSRFGSVISWNLPSLAPGESARQVLRATVDNESEHPAPASGSQIVLDAIVKSGATKAAGASSRVLVQAARAPFDLSVTGPARAAPGATVDYTFHYGNTGSSAASGLLRAPVPPGARIVLASQGAVQRGSSVEWDLGRVAPGHSDLRVLRLQLDRSLAAGKFWSIEPELQAAGSRAPARASLSTLVGTPSALQLTLAAAPSPALPGGTIVYKLEVTNASPSAPSGNFTVFATIPEHVGVSGQASAKCSPQDCYYNGHVARHESLVLWNVSSLAPGETAPLQFSAVVDKPATEAPPPNGSLLHLQAHTSSKEAAESLTLVVGTADSAGKGTPLVPLTAAGQAVAATPAPAEPVVAVNAPAEAEPDVEDIPDVEIEAQLPAGEDAVSPAESQQRKSWKQRDWEKHCSARWQTRRWDRSCAKIWWKRKDWNKYCRVEGRKHHGWRRYCQRDFRTWHFARASHRRAVERRAKH